MSEKVLSQDEIQALFSAMSNGRLDTQAGNEHEVTDYNLTSQKIKLLRQFDLLEEIHDSFAALLQSSLSAKLRVHVDADLISTETVAYSDFIKDFKKPTALVIFQMEPLSGSAMMIIVENLVFSMIDCLFGGKGAAIEKHRDFTLIEKRIITKLAAEILKDLENAWEHIHSIRTMIRKIESNPDFIRAFALYDMVIAVVFSIQSAEFSGNIYLCIPYLMLEPIKNLLSSNNIRNSVVPDVRHNSDIQESLKEAEVSLTVELGKSIQRIGDILNLKVGDTLWLNNGPRDPVSVLVEKKIKFKGILGSVKEKRAVRISSLIE